MVEKSLTITGMYHVELLASKPRIAPMKVQTSSIRNDVGKNSSKADGQN